MDTRRIEPFFNRQNELAALTKAWRRRQGGAMAMVYGRRRLGKTYLLQRLLSNAEDATGRCYYLADQSTPEAQRFALAERLLEAFPSTGYAPGEIAVSWNSLLRFFSARASSLGGQGRATLVLDEFPYLVAGSPELPSVVQAWWDQEGSREPGFVVLCGSQLSTMAALGSESAPLFGRFNAGILRLQPMRYDDVAEFYRDSPQYGVRERLLMYGALGGAPRYHALVDVDEPWDEQIVDLLMKPGAPLENETRYLLSSEQIRDPAPHNAILGAIAQGRTRYTEIGGATGIEEAALARPLKVLQELDWVRRETPYGESSDRRALYRLADPYLQFGYRFVSPLASAFQFDDPMRVFRERIEPRLSDYMGWSVFEGVCGQWLQRRAKDALGLSILDLGRYWSRDGRVEIDIVAGLDEGRKLFGECKWSAGRPVGIGTYVDLKAKVASLPQQSWASGAVYALFSVGGFTDDLRSLAASEGDLHLVDGERLFAEPSG